MRPVATAPSPEPIRMPLRHGGVYEDRGLSLPDRDRRPGRGQRPWSGELRRQPARRGGGARPRGAPQARHRRRSSRRSGATASSASSSPATRPGSSSRPSRGRWRSPAATPTRCAWRRSASSAPRAGIGTARAKAVLACAVLGVPFPLAAVPDTTAVHPATLDRRRRRRRHPGGARDRRRRQEGLPRRAHRHDRRPHGDVRQDLPDARLRGLHPDPEDGRRRPARDRSTS